MERLEIGDVVNLSPDARFRKQPVLRLGQVTDINPASVTVVTLDGKNQKQTIQKANLYINDLAYAHKDQAALRALGAKNLWMHMTPRQKNKYDAKQRTSLKKSLEDAPAQKRHINGPRAMKNNKDFLAQNAQEFDAENKSANDIDFSDISGDEKAKLPEPPTALARAMQRRKTGDARMFGF